MPEAQGDGAELAGLRVLVVEDKFLLAEQTAAVLADRGAGVVGPAASIADALALIAAEPPDAAVLNVTLKGGPSAPVAAALQDLGVPFVIVSGHTAPSEPELRDAPVLPKPVCADELIRAVARAVAGDKGRA